MSVLFLIIGLLLGGIISFLFLKGKQNANVDTSAFDKKIQELEMAKAITQTQLDSAAAENNRLSLENKDSRERFAAELKATREQASEELKQEKEKYNAELNSLRTELNDANVRIAKSLEAFKGQEEKYLTLNKAQEEKFVTLKGELENVHKKYSTEFENIASKILEEKSEKFTKQNRENLDIVLGPLKENIKAFEEKVEKAYKSESNERVELKTEIKNLIFLNQKISEEANNLAKALKGDNKKQGNWGEVILEKVLERSGLVKDQEYRTQFSSSNADGKRIQPDAVILLPDNKHVIVDAKVSLVAYEACVNAVTEEDRERYVKEHLLSVRNHVRTLSDKDYHSSTDFNTPDFVLLFIPIESSFSVAVQADQELFSFAWDKKIVIVSPSTLLATLRTIASLWKQERQTKNVMEIAREGGELYDKFVGFLEDMQKIEKAIELSSKAYLDAVNKLSTGKGNIVRRIQHIQQLGAKTNKDKSIPARFLQNDETPSITEETN
ncbi:MAG TPA: DNA recombination protein RmuC [Bacteroidia bacterium]|jgi:DNA recombination protein RmuC|nr:DNA recombination protein RmuC [Bacteroidia bacterium]